MHQLPESAVHTATSSSFTQPDIWNLEDIGDYLGISQGSSRLGEAAGAGHDQTFIAEIAIGQ